MRSIFYTLSALTMLVVISILVTARHERVRADQQAMVEQINQEKLYHFYWNCMELIQKALGGSVEISRGDYVQVNANFTATKLNYDHLIDNIGKVSNFMEFYSENELGLDTKIYRSDLEYDLIWDGSYKYALDPYNTNYTWTSVQGLVIAPIKNLTWARVIVDVNGTTRNWLYPTGSEEYYGPQDPYGGNVTVNFTVMSSIVVDLSEVNYTGRTIRVITYANYTFTNKSVIMRPKGLYLNITDGQTLIINDELARG